VGSVPRQEQVRVQLIYEILVVLENLPRGSLRSYYDWRQRYRRKIDILKQEFASITKAILEGPGHGRRGGLFIQFLSVNFIQIPVPFQILFVILQSHWLKFHFFSEKKKKNEIKKKINKKK